MTKNKIKITKTTSAYPDKLQTKPMAVRFVLKYSTHLHQMLINNQNIQLKYSIKILKSNYWNKTFILNIQSKYWNQTIETEHSIPIFN